MDRVKLVIYFSFLVLVLSASGCANFVSKLGGFDRPQRAVKHTVRYQGETVSAISRWYTGSPRNASAIRSFNGLGNRRLQRSDNIWVPGRLVIRRRPLPKTYLVSLYAPKERERERQATLARINAGAARGAVRRQNATPKATQMNGVTAVSPIQKSSAISMVPVSPSSLSVSTGETPRKLARSDDPMRWMRQEIARDLKEEEILKDLTR